MIQTAWCGTMEGTIYSGTAVVDHNNSLGKQVGDTKTLVAFFTSAVEPLFHQSAAYSTDRADRGRTYTLVNDGGAVVPNQGFTNSERDPKEFVFTAFLLKRSRASMLNLMPIKICRFKRQKKNLPGFKPN